MGDGVSWEVVYPQFDGSIALRGARKKEGLTQTELSNILGISRYHLSEMEHGKRPIGEEMAKRLSEILHTDYRVFLEERE